MNARHVIGAAVAVGAIWFAVANDGGSRQAKASGWDEICPRIENPASLVAGFRNAGLVRMTDLNRLVVNQSLWFSAMRQKQRLGLLAAYACSTGRKTVRAVSATDGRRLAVCSRGDCFETDD